MAERGKPTGMLTHLENQISALQKEVSELKDTLNVYENWNSEIKKMYEKTVRITTMEGSSHCGKLVWSDRYNLCIEQSAQHRKIINKGGIISIELVD